VTYLKPSFYLIGAFEPGAESTGRGCPQSNLISIRPTAIIRSTLMGYCNPKMASIFEAVFISAGLIQEVCPVERVSLHRLETGVADDSP
jgi:hypothetical protein